jgi:hypothetical protein
MITEKRNVSRQATSLDIKFAVTEVGGRDASRVEAKGSIVDISDQGFCMITTYPLQKGHAITIRGRGNEKMPGYGLVKWIEKAGSNYRAGLCHRFPVNI